MKLPVFETIQFLYTEIHIYEYTVLAHSLQTVLVLASGSKLVWLLHAINQWWIHGGIREIRMLNVKIGFCIILLGKYNVILFWEN